MTAKEMLEKVRNLKGQAIFNGFEKPKEVNEFFNENWMQILDILDDALYTYVGKENE